MAHSQRKWLTTERFIYFVIWTIMFLAPLFSLIVHGNIDSHYDFDWRHVFIVWQMISVFLIAFIVHDLFLAPILIKQHNLKRYLVFTLVLVAVFQVYQCAHRPADMPPRGGPHTEFRADDAQAGHNALPPQDRLGNKPPQHGAPQHDVPPLRPPIDRHDILAFVILILMLSANLGVKNYYAAASERLRLQELESRQLKQEKEVLAKELEYLKYQINPHFFMNMLNNVHALVDIDPELAKKTIVKLSRFMRYMLSEGEKDRVSLSTQVTAVKQFIDLMKLRYSENVDIRLNVPEVTTERYLPPLLLMSFLENAFKHGVSYEQPSFIHIDLITDETCEHLTFKCANSKAPSVKQSSGGIGLANVKKRLDIIYEPGEYSLDIQDDTDRFTVTLTLPLYAE